MGGEGMGQVRLEVVRECSGGRDGEQAFAVQSREPALLERQDAHTEFHVLDIIPFQVYPLFPH